MWKKINSKADSDGWPLIYSSTKCAARLIYSRNMVTSINSHIHCRIGKKIRPFEKSPTDGYSDYLIYAIFDIDISPAWMVCIDNKLLSWKFAVWRWRCIRFDWFVYNLQDDNNGKKVSLKIVIWSCRCHPFVFVQTTVFSVHWLAGCLTDSTHNFFCWS